MITITYTVYTAYIYCYYVRSIDVFTCVYLSLSIYIYIYVYRYTCICVYACNMCIYAYTCTHMFTSICVITTIDYTCTEY